MTESKGAVKGADRTGVTHTATSRGGARSGHGHR
jgi:hypothetical protein